MKILRVDDDVHQMIKSFADAQDRTISSFVNRHFREMYSPVPNENTIAQPGWEPSKTDDRTLVRSTPEKNASSASADSFLDATKGTAVAVARPSMKIAAVSISEQPCCTAKSPCRHWSWSSMREGYVNSLSGRFREAEV